MKTDSPPPVTQAPYTLALEPADIRRLASLCGPLNQHIKQIEQHLNVKIHQRGHVFTFGGGTEENAYVAHTVLERMYLETQEQQTLTSELIHIFLQTTMIDKPVMSSTITDTPSSADANLLTVRTPTGTVKARGTNQQNYVKAIQRNDINFGIGPAGTGKTYLAVACAVEALQRNKIERLLLVRPAVEAGEKLGFLPGDLAQKIDPYLRPLYDALYEMLGFETVTKLVERQVIEIAPLAYMRGRTLNKAFIILDESQNTTAVQMKMFLTRIGFGSTAVITGDPTQIDLPRGTRCGLLHACEILRDVEGISFTQFSSRDVVRHPLVQRIVDAYDSHENGAVA